MLRNILVEPIVDKLKSGIVLPDQDIKLQKTDVGYYKGKVLSVGQGMRRMDGGVAPLLVKKGDVILFWKYTPITVDGKDYMITYEDHIIATLNKKDE